jgi:hypothetical protein
MDLEDMIILARRARECAERARQEEAFWEQLIAERREADAAGDIAEMIVRVAA